MDYFVTVLFLTFSVLGIFALVDRVCSCIERCATAKAYSKVLESGTNTDAEDLQKKIGEK